MLFNSVQFLLFFPLAAMMHFALPHRLRWVLLLLASYYFYMCWSPKYALLLFFTTASTYLCGLLLGSTDIIPRKKVYLAITLVINLGILFIFKYFNFLNEIATDILDIFGINVHMKSLNLLLPVGISFYTFQAIGYCIDVYRGKIQPEKHFGLYMLFVGFFPLILSGPIERAGNLLPQFREKHSFDFERLKSGLLLMGWGLFKKLVIADRLAILVNTVYDSPDKYAGFQLVIATVFFSFQIYCDFSGYSDMARGCARILGFRVMNNFSMPYFSLSIKEFWKKWHISLSSWFRDYLYFPLGGSRVKRIRFYFNTLVVFAVSGLWHGAAMTFIIWGLLNGVYQVIGHVLRPLKDKLIDFFNVKTGSFTFRACQLAANFALVSFAWLFFRANSLGDAFLIIKKLFVFNPGSLLYGQLFTLGLDKPDFVVALLGIFILLLVDLWQSRSSITEFIRKEPLVFRWAVYFALIFTIIIFGIYGENNETQFIYFQF